ncbi:Plasmodium exported protein (PHISTa), unknown, putative [Plasmodium sp. gorilla clade G1]|nr:Plasmodium exported protein (PHISTa), unknown, putative [Plasmodium sp. gorilla clade G1]
MLIRKFVDFCSLYDNDKKKERMFHSFWNYIRFIYISIYIIISIYMSINDNYKNSNFVLVTCNNANSRNLSEVMRKNNLTLNDGKVRNNVDVKKDNSKHMRSSHIRKEEHKDEIDEKQKFNNNNLEKTNNKTNNDSIKNMNHCRFSNILTKGELYNVLNGVEEFPSRRDLFNIWNQALRINRDTVDILLEDLSLHLYKDLCHFDYGTLIDNESCREVSGNPVQHFLTTTSIKEKEFTKNFHLLLKNKISKDEFRNYIYSFLQEFDKLYIEIYMKYKI